MEQNLYGIGELAALSGLSISALRFYDGADVLRPARVDPQTGYRKYAGDQVGPARLIARLRRVGLPLAEIRRVLAGPTEVALALLDQHLRRLEDGLADARRELSTVRAQLTTLENPMTMIVLPVQRFLDAAAEVRYAASSNPELPMLCGVLLDVDAAGPALKLVATDRYRLAVSTAELDSATGDSTTALLPIGLVDQLLAELAGGTGSVTIRFTAAEVSFTMADKVIRGATLQHEFPDYQRLVRLTPDRRVPITAAQLRQAVDRAPTRTMTREQDGAEYQVSVLSLDQSGSLRVTAEAPQPDELAVGVNREFLLQALDAGRGDQLSLELDGPIGPLAIRDPDRDGSFSILMPVRL